MLPTPPSNQVNTNSPDTKISDATITHESISSVASIDSETETPRITHVPEVIEGPTRKHRKLDLPYGEPENVSHDVYGGTFQYGAKFNDTAFLTRVTGSGNKRQKNNDDEQIVGNTSLFPPRVLST